MIDLTGQVSMPFFEKSRITGSDSGMRFLIKKITIEGKEDPRLEAIAWPEPYCFEVTPKEKMRSASFHYDASGLKDAIDWLNEQHDELEKF